jgi:hypothetical protein
MVVRLSTKKSNFYNSWVSTIADPQSNPGQSKSKPGRLNPRIMLVIYFFSSLFARSPCAPSDPRLIQLPEGFGANKNQPSRSRPKRARP